jgi:hypothetical protein
MIFGRYVELPEQLCAVIKPGGRYQGHAVRRQGLHFEAVFRGDAK